MSNNSQSQHSQPHKSQIHSPFKRFLSLSPQQNQIETILEESITSSQNPSPPTSRKSQVKFKFDTFVPKASRVISQPNTSLTYQQPQTSRNSVQSSILQIKEEIARESRDKKLNYTQNLMIIELKNKLEQVEKENGLLKAQLQTQENSFTNEDYNTLQSIFSEQNKILIFHEKYQQNTQNSDSDLLGNESSIEVKNNELTQSQIEILSCQNSNNINDVNDVNDHNQLRNLAGRQLSQIIFDSSRLISQMWEKLRSQQFEDEVAKLKEVIQALQWTNQSKDKKLLTSQQEQHEIMRENQSASKESITQLQTLVKDLNIKLETLETHIVILLNMQQSIKSQQQDDDTRFKHKNSLQPIYQKRMKSIYETSIAFAQKKYEGKTQDFVNRNSLIEQEQQSSKKVLLLNVSPSMSTERDSKTPKPQNIASQLYLKTQLANLFFQQREDQALQTSQSEKKCTQVKGSRQIQTNHSSTPRSKLRTIQYL